MRLKLTATVRLYHTHVNSFCMNSHHAISRFAPQYLACSINQQPAGLTRHALNPPAGGASK